MAKTKETTVEEITEVYGGANDAAQDEGDNLVKLEDK